jgi:hypothetical protein
MVIKKKTTAAPECCSGSCCKVESIVTVDERGQILLPKDTRDKAEIHNGKVCCFMLIKAGELANMAKDVLGPLAKEIF